MGSFKLVTKLHFCGLDYEVTTKTSPFLGKEGFSHLYETHVFSKGFDGPFEKHMSLVEATECHKRIVDQILYKEVGVPS